VKVRDSLLCYDSVLVSIFQPEDITIQEIISSHENTVCFNDSNGQAEVFASGGTPGYEYSIDKVSWNTSPLFENLYATDYYIWVRDTNECYDSIPISITQPTDITIQEITGSHEDVLCFGDSTGQLQTTATGGTPNYEFSINKVNWNINPLFGNLFAAEHTIWVRDANECYDSLILSIFQPDKIVIETEVSNDTLNVAVSGGTPVIQYSLDGSQLVISGFFTGLDEGEHTIIVTDGNSCTADTIILIDTIPGPAPTLPVTIYDAFSPNDDLKNDVWNIGNIDLFPNCVIKIYNTWGKLVFESDGYHEPWDGKHDGKDLPAGTYYYIIDLGEGNDKFTGTVNIVK